MEATDVLIIGGGIAGLSLAWALPERRPGRVVLVEREATLGTWSSGRNAAILRTLGADRLQTELALRSARFLGSPPPGFSPVPLVDPVGLALVADASRAAELQRLVDAADHPAVRRVGPSELARLAPHFRFPEGGAAFLHPEEGRIDIAALLDAFARGARERGTELRTGTRVAGLSVDGGRIRGAVLADGSELRARTTVLAAGGWAGALGRRAGSRVELRPTRRHLMVTAPDERVDPRWPVVWQLGDEFYCRPESGGMLLCACDLETVDPDRCEVDASVQEQIAEKSGRMLPAFADSGAAHLWCGVRTLTADSRFAIGPDPQLEGLFWVAGLGGAGMTSAPEVGRIAAELLGGDGATRSDADAELAAALAPRRLATAAA